MAKVNRTGRCVLPMVVMRQMRHKLVQAPVLVNNALFEIWCGCRFKPPETYPRFIGETQEEKIKQIFKDTIKVSRERCSGTVMTMLIQAREKQRLKTGGSPRSKMPDQDKLLMQALSNSK